jgi:hypothetical protein
MTLARTLAIAAFAVASFPLLAQQPGSSGQQPAQQPGAPAISANPAQEQQSVSPEASTPTAAATLSPVKGELVDKLDTKTAKTGDPVVIKTQSNIKTADGTEIPKGSKLVGRVTGVKPIGQGSQNSQVALQFDHAELQSGQELPIRAEIQELSSSDGGAATPDTMAASPSPSPSMGTTAPGGSMTPGGSMNGSNAATASPATQPQMGGGSSITGSTGPAPGTIVARTGNITIRATSIPGVLLATNAPGQQDPRMAQSSGVLLGPQHDIHLDGGTRVVVGVSVTRAGNPGGE